MGFTEKLCIAYRATGKNGRFFRSRKSGQYITTILRGLENGRQSKQSNCYSQLQINYIILYYSKIFCTNILHLNVPLKCVCILDKIDQNLISSFTECVFGKEVRELGSQWIPDLGVPIGILYCMRCECVPVSYFIINDRTYHFLTACLKRYPTWIVNSVNFLIHNSKVGNIFHHKYRSEQMQATFDPRYFLCVVFAKYPTILLCIWVRGLLL